MSQEDIRSHKLLYEAVLEVDGKLLHWVEALAEFLDARFRKRGLKELVFNGGLSVSGLQHVGRLRGEIIIPDVVAQLLKKRGYTVKQYLTLYTQDAWKGKPEQQAAFRNPEEARKYVGWPLARVPDPLGEKSSWVERFWEDFGPYISRFTSGSVEVVTTTELYRGALREFVKLAITRREEIRRIVNKYRGRNPYPEGWIPFEARCAGCGRIDSTKATAVNLDRDEVEYTCTACGYRGKAAIWDGKLNWRVEWVGVWWALRVSFEPYGKDHATPGGSRDSANELATKVFGFQPPEGLPYEWVSLRTGKGESDMTSSGFVGITPREWLEVAHPEVLRFLYLRVPPMRKVTVSLEEVPQYYEAYYKAERVYYGVESTGNKKEDYLLAKSYELSHTGNPPDSMPAQIPYTHAAILAQVVPESLWGSEAIRRLQKSGHIASTPSRFDRERVLSLLPRARRWVEAYGPPQMRIRILSELPSDIANQIPEEHRTLLRKLGEALEKVEPWAEESIKQALLEFTRGWPAAKRREFYRYFYMVFVGSPSGPRAAPLLSLLDKSFVLERLLSL
ncbi:MAG: lysine--tRNA ligase [Thermoproteota archaeon]